MIKGKYIVAGLIGLVTISGAVAYLQYKKLMDYVLTYKSIKFNKLSSDLISFDLTLLFQNKSTLKFTIEKQIYDVYINNIFITTLKSDVSQTIQPKSDNYLVLTISFNPKVAFDRLKLTALTLAANRSDVKIKVVTKMKLKWGVVGASVPFTYENNLKDMMA